MRQLSPLLIYLAAFWRTSSRIIVRISISGLFFFFLRGASLKILIWLIFLFLSYKAAVDTSFPLPDTHPLGRTIASTGTNRIQSMFMVIILCSTFLPPVKTNGQSRMQCPFLQIRKSQLKENDFVVMNRAQWPRANGALLNIRNQKSMPSRFITMII